VEPTFLTLETGGQFPPPWQTVYYDLYWYHNDHLGTPQAMTDTNKTVVWRGDYLPFGELYYEMASATNNIRFPGQYQVRVAHPLAVGLFFPASHLTSHN
jgi:uncharacterized protein RhaS with RHS repeats